jgi:hypothetical protein
MTAQTLPRTNIQNLFRSNSLLSQALQWIVFTYQVVVIILFMIGIYFAIGWIKEPFIGSFYEHTLVFNDSGPDDPAWAFNDQVSSGDQLIAVNGVTVRSHADVRNVLVGNFVPGDTIPVTVHFKNGETRNIDILLHPFPSNSITLYFLIPTFISSVFLIVSFWIFGLRRNEPAGRAFSLFTSSLALATGLYFNILTTHEFTIPWTIGCAMSGGGMIALALSFRKSRALSSPALTCVGPVFWLHWYWQPSPFPTFLISIIPLPTSPTGLPFIYSLRLEFCFISA